MTELTTRRYNNGEVLSGAQRLRRWAPEEKVRIVEKTYLPGMRASLVARRHGIGAGQLFTWRRLMAQCALTAAGSGEESVPASEYRALQAQVSELQRLLGKKPMEAEILREAVSRPAGPKKLLLRLTSLPGATASTCPRCTTNYRPSRADALYCPTPSWSPTSSRWSGELPRRLRS